MTSTVVLIDKKQIMSFSLNVFFRNGYILTSKRVNSSESDVYLPLDRYKQKKFWVFKNSSRFKEIQKSYYFSVMLEDYTNFPFKAVIKTNFPSYFQSFSPSK